MTHTVFAAALAAAALAVGTAAAAQSKTLPPTNLRCEYLVDPLGIDVTSPRLTWIVAADHRGEMQASYQVLVATRPELLTAGKADKWDTGKVVSGQSVLVGYSGKPLRSRERVYWKVRVWGTSGKPSAYSKLAAWEMGLLKPADWTAKWISDVTKLPDPWEQAKWIWFPEGKPQESTPQCVRLFRKRFGLDKLPDRAILYVTADDKFEAYVNGQMVGKSEGAPGSEDWRHVREYDVKSLLREGENVLAFRATNLAGPAGLLFRLNDIVSDAGTVCTTMAPEGWEVLEFGAFDWKPAMELGPTNMAPWGLALSSYHPAPVLRKDFSLRKAVKSARVYVTALGSYRLHINGKRVGDDVLTPDWTDYRKRVTYQTYDVTKMLAAGKNAIGAMLGDGWYGSRLAWGPDQHFKFGPPPPRLLIQLEVKFGDGTVQTLGSDGTWKWVPGPVFASDIYDGETFDARVEQPGWDRPGFDDLQWREAAVVPAAKEILLTAQMMPPQRVVQTLTPKKMTTPKPGVYVFDLGQNMVGWARLRVTGPAGTQVRLRFAELLEPDGNVYTANLRAAKCIDTYTLRGGGPEVFEPHFTYHGFRYVEVTGYPGEPTVDNITGCVVHTAYPQVGTFECSDDTVNQVWHNILWGQWGNTQSVPTDCPQRDERLGWMGDANVFSPTACFNAEMAPFYTKWMFDVVDGQDEMGSFCDVSPRLWGGGAAPAWGEAGVTVPWQLYLMYGDKRVLARNYAAMARWVAYIDKANPNHLWDNRRTNDYGDWVAAGSFTPRDVLATAVFAYDAWIMARVSEVLGKTAEAKKYDTLFNDVKAAFNKAYVQTDGRIKGDSQTCYVLALKMGLLAEDERQLAANWLTTDIIKRSWHLSTGFVGSAYLMDVLAEAGRPDIAYRLLLNKDYPSWGYMVSRGATTIWERWDGIRSDGTLQDPGMNSFNHYAFGAVGEWLYRYVAGIRFDPGKPGFEHVIIHPVPGEGLTSASATYRSVRGLISSAWQSKPGLLILDVTIPYNTTASIYVPGTDVTESAEPIADAPGVKFLYLENGCSVFDVGGGTYHFEAKRG